MSNPPMAEHLAALRRRFLMEDTALVADWLWGEHPQTAAFVLNWIGDLELTANYLSPLPTTQQADVLCRLCYLDEHRPLDSFQQELLIEALQRINPRPRPVEEPADEAAGARLSGLALAHAYLNLLREDEFNDLILDLEELDRNLARLCHNRYTTLRETEGSNLQHNLYGILNTFCDYIGYKFNRSLGARTVVFVDAVELQSDAAQNSAEGEGGGCFKVSDQEGRLVVFMRFSPRLLYHYLEMSYGAPRPFFHANFEKPAFTSLEQYVAVTFAGELANALLQAVDLAHAEQRLVTEYLEGNLLSAELARLGEETVLHARLTVRMAKSTIGTMQLIFPASQLQAAADLGEHQPMAGFAGAPRMGADAALPGAAERAAPTAVLGDAAASATNDVDGATDDEDVGDTDLENLLFQSALEDAEDAQERMQTPRSRPLDLLLAGYRVEDIDRLLPEREDDLRRAADTHYHYGSILFQRELFAEATEALEQALRCNPDHGHAQLLQAASWGEQGLYLKEILAFKRLVAEKRCLPEAYVLLARRLSFLGKVNESLDALKKAYKMGFNANEIVDTDPCFDPLRKSSRWRQFFDQLS